MDPLEIFTRGAHKQVTKSLKVCTVFHHLHENVSNIAFTADVGDYEDAVGHPFPNIIVFVFYVMIAFGGHVVVPLDASVIIFVKVCTEFCIGDGVT
jgi:hypothetical protein